MCLAAVLVCLLVLMHVSSCCLCVSVSADVTPTCLAAVLVCLLVLMSPPHVSSCCVLVCLLVLMSPPHV